MCHVFLQKLRLKPDVITLKINTKFKLSTLGVKCRVKEPNFEFTATIVVTLNSLFYVLFVDFLSKVEFIIIINFN